MGLTGRRAAGRAAKPSSVYISKFRCDVIVLAALMKLLLQMKPPKTAGFISHCTGSERHFPTCKFMPIWGERERSSSESELEGSKQAKEVNLSSAVGIQWHHFNIRAHLVPPDREIQSVLGLNSYEI